MKKLNYVVDIIIFKQNYDSYDVDIFLEYIPEINLYPSKYNFFMPNPELYEYDKYFDRIQAVDAILCKTKICHDIFSKFHDNCIYTKFMTNIPKEIRTKEYNKDSNTIIHFAGKSWMKNTKYLLKVWKYNDGFMHIDPNIKLYVTCYNFCLKGIDRNNLPKKLKLYDRKIENDEHFGLLMKANVSFNFSEAGGYIILNYIDESRFFDTFIITIDSPPTNEFIKDNGILLKKFNKENIKNMEGLYKVYPDMNELKSTIEYVIKNKNNLSYTGREYFLEDKQF